ncbi:type VI secretion system protein TssA [Aquabacterium sp.]|uniref:type VI secretion system protein TssA n=1 Tax=Aquabacterium sp. TaxID=1872578 RepID=UPI002C323802|nr:type VI secretion system protein TssA [Aquabacterium sp.]HSW03536.1 type VI secretion system protein TssA [Aquabacterium sp.]
MKQNFSVRGRYRIGSRLSTARPSLKLHSAPADFAPRHRWRRRQPGGQMESDSIDIGPLLAPLETGDQGAGLDLRADYSASSSYQRLRDARSAARAEERTRDADGESEGPEAAGWRDILTIGQKALATQTKDLEIAAWLTESLVRIHGLSGATAGARLIAGLCEGFWDACFPQPDEDGLEGRASPIGGLSGSGADGTIMQALRRLPMFRRADGTGIGLYQWEQAEQVATLDEARQQARYAAGAPEFKTLEAEARLDKAYLVSMGRQTTAAIEAWRELDRVLDARFGSEAPSIRKVTTLLDRMIEIIGRLGGVVADAGPEEAAAAVVDAGSNTGAASGASAGGGALQTRDGALRELDRIAEYFRRTEPHSPLAYTLEEAVRRGRMSLSELLSEVLPDADVRNAMLQRLGIRPESQ